MQSLNEWLANGRPHNCIINADCLKGMSEIPDSSIDLIVTDPPYFIENLKENMKAETLRKSSKNNIFHAKWDSDFDGLEGYKEFMKKVLLQFKRVLKDKAQCYMFFSYHHIDWIITMIKELDFRYYKFLIWYKPDTMGVFPNQYGCNYELILWFRKKGDKGYFKNHIGVTQRDVFTFNSTLNTERKDSGYHPTAKPRALVRQLIKNASDEGDLILDAFMGSGTTAIACQQINRNFIGFELNPEYLKNAEKRLGQKNLLNNLKSFDPNLEGGIFRRMEKPESNIKLKQEVLTINITERGMQEQNDDERTIVGGV